MPLPTSAPASAQEWRAALAAVGFFTSLDTAGKVHDWAGQPSKPLVIHGEPYCGKSKLAKSISGVLDPSAVDGASGLFRPAYGADWKFETFFYDEKQLYPRVLEGTFLRTLKQTLPLNFVVVERFYAPPDDTRVDRALAELVEHNLIRVGSRGEVVTKPADIDLRIVVVATDDYGEGRWRHGAFYEALERVATFLEIDDPDDRHYQFHVLSNLFPGMSRSDVAQVILFVEMFNRLPGLEKYVTLGERIDLLRCIAENRMPVTVDTFVRLESVFVKTTYDQRLLAMQARGLVARARSTPF